jgi:O-antigen biosynthesis protein WbqP
MKRLLDLLVATIMLVALSPIMLIVGMAVRFTSKGPIFYWSDRIGKDNRMFKMPKFRTMVIDTPVVATDLLRNPSQYLTPIGSFLRTTSLDELPQLLCVIKGEMSLVGPRPALFNQYELIRLRNQLHLEHLRPGLTGWAQINGRDELCVDRKVALDLEYYQNQGLLFDLKILWHTAFKVLGRKNVKH